MKPANQYSLLAERRFAPFFVTQFLGAFNDNIFRNGLIIVVTFHGTKLFGLDASQLANIAGALFILPFFLFSALAGQLADKFEKARLIRRIKLLEVALMSVAAFAFLNDNFSALFFVLFLMGCQSALFGPVKYAYLPQQLASNELIGGNALVESGTYLAIILGLIVGGFAVAADPIDLRLLSGALIAMAVFGYVLSRFIPETRAVDPELVVSANVWKETWRVVGFARADPQVFLSILGISWFWFFGSVMTLQIPGYTLDVLRGNEGVTTLLLVAFALGVGSGALMCEKMSGKRIELGLVPFGSIGLSVFAIDLYFAQPTMLSTDISNIAAFLGRSGSFRILADLALLGAFGAFYSVPLYALIQQRASSRRLSRIIAANNIVNALFMVAAAMMALLLLNLGLTIPQLFLVLAILNASVAAYIYCLLPEFLMRFLAWILVNSLYRIRTKGIENVPETGPAVLVCNHVSYVDALLIGGSVPRPVRFVMWFRIFDIPLLNFLFRTAKAIPISSASEDADLLARAMDQIDEELADGNLVCIFPEGAITRDGEIQPFRPGVDVILRRRAVPVVPISLSGLWGSWFSRKQGKVRRLPGRLRLPVCVNIGGPVSPDEVTATKLELLVRNLRGRMR